MNVAGVLVHATPAKLVELRRALAALPGVELHAATDDGRLVLTVEDAAVSAGDTVLALHRLDGVLSAALVYHHFEPNPETLVTDAGAQAPGSEETIDDPVTA